MIARSLVVAMALVVFASPARALDVVTGAAAGSEASREVSGNDARSDAKEQVEFGIRVAQNGLWKEAAYRWERAVQLDPSYGAAWNNLAIAYEQQGNFDKAREAYEKAVTLEPDNALFRQNYDLFKEINDRTKRRSGK